MKPHILILAFLLLPCILPAHNIAPAQEATASLSCSTSLGKLYIEASITIPENITLLLNASILILKTPTAISLLWTNETKAWTATPSEYLISWDTTQWTNTTIAWLLIINFTKAEIGTWTATLTAHDALNRTIKAEREFDYLAYWADPSIKEENDLLKAQGAPHIIRANTTITFLSLTGQILTIHVNRRGAITLNSTWGQPSWVSIDDHITFNIIDHPQIQYDPFTNTLTVVASYSIEIAWPSQEQPPPAPFPQPPPEQPEAPQGPTIPPAQTAILLYALVGTTAFLAIRILKRE